MAFDGDNDSETRPPDEQSGFSVSRRSFLKTVGGTSIAAGVLTPGAADGQAGPAPVGPGDVPIELSINGKTHKLSVEPRVTLLDAMRDRLDITGL
jgi:xanthine dehydrogenase YagT iron-sulfur-binding subunit